METIKMIIGKNSGTAAENTPEIPVPIPNAPVQPPTPDTTGIDTKADKTREEALPQKVN